MSRRRSNWILLVVGICQALACQAALAWQGAGAVTQDRVKRVQGNTYYGKITEMSPTELTVELGANKRKVSVLDIETVSFDSEPNELTQGRLASRAGRYQDAVTALAKLDLASIKREEVAQEVLFYQGLSLARLSLGGKGKKEDAVKKLMPFYKEYKESYHYYEACELLGDLALALANNEKANEFYDQVANAPWPDYKLRATVLSGRALVGQKQFDRAITRFDEALALGGNGKEVDRQRLAAKLGKAEALAGARKHEQAITAIQEIMAEGDPENADFQARAYVTLGNAYRAAGKNTDALFAFLHVDLLYSRMPAQHAEALANLVVLCQEAGDKPRAAEARQTLKQKYPDSPWAAKL